MTLLVGGTVAAIVGLLGLIFWFSEFLHVLMGTVPIVLLLGGILAVYVGIDDLQEKLREERQRQQDNLEKAREEIEAVKAQAEQYREEIDRLRQEVRQREQ